MKKFISIATILIFLLLAVPVLAVGAGTWNVDVGNPASEASVTMSGWSSFIGGSDNAYGNYGGIANCRTVWESSDEAERCASITFTYDECVQPVLAAWSALDGQADNDGYTVYVDGVLVFTYLDQITPETWFEQDVDLTQFVLPNSKTHTVEICATGIAWSGIDTWGQVAIDEVILETVPCEGDTELDVDVDIIDNPNCICIDVVGAVDFGDLYAGDTETIVDAFTITNCGNVPVKVTAETDVPLYETALYFDNELAESVWWDTITAGSNIMPDAKIVVPDPYTTGSVSGTVIFWAELAAP